MAFSLREGREKCSVNLPFSFLLSEGGITAPSFQLASPGITKLSTASTVNCLIAAEYCYEREMMEIDKIIVDMCVRDHI